jgi:Gpi18-like mannosyltransferase
MGKVFKAWWFKYLILGIVIRVILMPITSHPDLWGHSFTAYFFAYKGELNIYQFLLNLPPDYPLVKNIGISDIFIYPPLTYFTLGIFKWLVKPFVDPNFLPWLMENMGNIYSRKDLFSVLFFYKLPYLFVDLGIAFLLSSLFSDEKKKKLAFILWILNPVTLYATFMIGQLDILAVFFTVLSVYFARKNKYTWSLISLGIGGSYKMYPLLFIIPAAFLFAAKFKDRIKNIAVGFLPFVLTVAPYLGSSAFRTMVLFQPKSQKMLYMNWPVSGAEGLYPFILGVTIIYLIAYYSANKEKLVNYFLSILLLIFLLTHYHPQWFVWLTPFLVIKMVEEKNKIINVVILLACWFVIMLLFEPSLSVGLFGPVWPAIRGFGGYADILSKYTDIFRFKSMVRSVFAGVSLYWIFDMLRGERLLDRDK